MAARSASVDGVWHYSQSSKFKKTVAAQTITVASIAMWFGAARVASLIQFASVLRTSKETGHCFFSSR